MIKKLLIILLVIGTVLSLSYKATSIIKAGSVCGGCGSCDDDLGCCCGSNSCSASGCSNCGSCSGSSSSSSGCSNSVACQGVTNDQTYDCSHNSLSGNGWNQTLMPSNTCYKRIGEYGNATNTCAPKWPSWSRDGGQNDLIWHDKTGIAAPWSPYAAYYYADIPMSSHPISWSDSMLYTDVYFNSNATGCGRVIYYKCYGGFGPTSGAYAKTGGDSFYSAMSITGTATYALTGGTLTVGTCN